MRPAAVGFQCPSCVAAGVKSTRSGRTPFGGARVANPGLTSSILIGLNVAVFLAILVTGGAASELVRWLVLRPDGICVDQFGDPSTGVESVCRAGGLFWLPGVADGAWWQLVTTMFTHIQPWHIAANMLGLWVLGPQLELALGRVRFLALYLLSGLGGSTLVFWLAPAWSSTLGASGAIFGLLGALLVLAIKVRGDVQSILGWLGLNIAFTFFFPGISWQGHIGGLLAGASLMAVFAYAPKGPRRPLWQAVGVAAYVVVLVLALVLRAASL